MRRLVGLRVARARRRRREQLISSLVAQSPGDSTEHEVARLLPPRSAWSQYRPRRRERRDWGGQGPALVQRALVRGVLSELRRPSPRFRWVERLRSFVEEVQSTAAAWRPGRPFVPQQVVAIPKARAGNGERYRIVVAYSLRDTMICGGFAGYLRDLVEPLLGPTVLAFRGPRDRWQRDWTEADAPFLPQGVSPRAPVTHHDAIRLIEHVRRQAGDGSLWVSECDIEKFFDVVEHAVVREQLDELLPGGLRATDPRFQDFLDSFLDGYTYPRTARPRALQQLAAQGVSRPVLADPAAIRAKRGMPEISGSIGVPQGSALSCVLANVVLSAADAAVQDAMGSDGETSLYVRYCDDVVLLSREREACVEGMAAYTAALDRLRLPCHPPQPVPRYTPGFWSRKSKLTYCWGIGERDVPWLAFVGYQLHRGGRVRVRRATIDRELAKQRAVVRDLAARIQAELARARAGGRSSIPLPSLGFITRSVEQHLVAIGVGYPCPNTARPSPQSVSWVAGFEVLDELPVDRDWLRDLDRGRRAALAELRARLLAGAARGELQLGASAAPERLAGSGPRRSRGRGYRDGPELSYFRGFAGPEPDEDRSPH